MTKQAKELQRQQQEQAGYKPGFGGQMEQMGDMISQANDGRAPYMVASQYIVPASAPLGQGVTLPIKVDPNDPAKIAIDWNNVSTGPARGEVRPVGGEGLAPKPTGGSAGGDSVAELERLAKLRDSGALTEAEFEQQKATILGS